MQLLQYSERTFWRWFTENEALVYGFEKDQEAIFNLLGDRLLQVHPDLTFEIGGVEPDGRRDFVISAGGLRAAIPAVEALHATAPDLPRWRFTAFRQPCAPSNIEVGGLNISPDGIRFALFHEGPRIGIKLFFDDYLPDDERFGLAGYLFLDAAIGEFTVMTKVGTIEFAGPDTEFFDTSDPFEDLATRFDEAVASIN